jgi:hypothetical protein
VDGSPRINLYYQGRPLPFVYRYDSGYGAAPSVVAGGPARPVLLRPGSFARFLVAKFRCEYGDGREASEVRVLLPGSMTHLHIALPAGGGGFGVSALVYCHGFAPGNRIDVSAMM